RTANSLSAGYRRSDGYIDNSDYRIFNALWQTRLQTGETSHIDFLAGYNNKSYGANTFYSATYPDQYDRTSEIASAINGSFGSRLKFVPQLYWSRHFDRFDLIRNTTTGRNHHRGDTYGANLMFRYSSTLGDTHFGGELRQEDILSSKLGKPLSTAHGIYTNYDERRQTNLVLEHTFNLRRFVFSAGVLGNYNTLQNDRFRFYPSASIAYRPVNYMKIFTTWSRSGRLPTFTDLYYTTETHTANETLQTETSESFDLGVNYRHEYFTLTLAGYLMKGRNMIDWVREQGQEKWSSWNHTEVDKRGLEIDLQAPLAFLSSSSSIKLNYARMFQECDSRGLESRYTLNYLRDKLTARLNHDVISGLTASWNFRFQNRMGTYRKYEGKTDMGLQSYPPFATLDLRLNYLYKHFAYHLDFNNIFDKGYFDIGNVPQAGFWLTGGIKYEF
ncbi:MAG: TonB-dependent receptor, partial [Tannerella sp.]|nr:TonB-dependent receptor [Tannerella sp.]